MIVLAGFQSFSKKIEIPSNKSHLIELFHDASNFHIFDSNFT